MAVATAAAEAHPSPPPPARRTWLAWIRLAWAVVDAVVCLLVASLWLFYWGLATLEIGQLACGWGCAVVTTTYKLLYVAGTTLALVLPFSMLVEHMLARERAAAVVPPPAAATDIEAAKVPVQAPALKTSDAAIWDKLCDVLRDPVIIGLLASLAFFLLVVIGVVVVGDSPVLGSLIYYVGASGLNAVDCFVLCPLMTVRIWRARMRARRALYVICS